MVFSRNVFPIVRKLEHVEFQSLVDYSSSRTRAAANTLAMRLSSIPEGDHNLFVLALSREVSSANALLGLGFMLFNDQQIRPPSSLRHLTPLMVQNRFLDWTAVSLAVKEGRDTGDDVLARYENCWWYPFDTAADIETFRQSPLNVIHAWQKQRKHLPAPISLPSRGFVNLQMLSDEELDRAWLIGCDALKAVDRELDANHQTITDITVLLAKCQATLVDLVAAEERAVRDMQSAEEVD